MRKPSRIVTVKIMFNLLHITGSTEISVHSLSIAFFFFNITASIYTERFMGLPVESDNLEHYKVRILFLC